MKLVFYLFIASLISCGGPKKNTSQTAVQQDLNLAAFLDSIWTAEQRPIRIRDSLGKLYGYESEEFNRQNEIYHQAHERNEAAIRELLDTHGWPNSEESGDYGNNTICNVLQHSSMEVREQYLPLMRQAVADGNLAPRLLVRAEDRLATDRGELQIYGGQIKYYPETQSFDVWPIKDPEHVDERRAAVGLPPMAEFLSNLRNPLVWDLEAQIKRSEAFMAAHKDVEKDKNDNK